jgi:glycosyltransferase involved in cell wall biosynthesis
MIFNKKPTISVVIPTYNRANMIVGCVESVLAQSYPVNEIIVVNDSSTDNTMKQLNKFKDNIIILKTEKQSGAQTARNIGIKSAKSEWIAFLDSDDEWLENKLEKQVLALKTTNYDQWTVIHGNCYIKNINSDKNKHWQLDYIDGKNVYKQLLSKSGTLFPSILTSKKALEKINYLDEDTPSYHEWDTAIRLAKYCRFIHIQEPLFIYNIHKNTISKNSDISIDGYQYIINKYQNEINKVCGEEILTNHLIINSVMALNNNKNKLGRAILKQIPNNSLKKSILQLFSYLKIKPIYFNKIIQFILRKK